jgi:hypothetical protein
MMEINHLEDQENIGLEERTYGRNTAGDIDLMDEIDA